MAATPSASSSFCSSSTRCSSPRGHGKNSRSRHDGAARDGYPEDLLFAPVMSCDFIRVPPDYHDAFAYLHETQLFFFDVLRKLNRMRTKDKRVCFITDYTINLAAADTGTVSRCSKVEDVAEIICDVTSRAVGIRMRARPFAVKPQNYLHWNCFFEMPVDLLLFAESQEQFSDLVRVLRFVYRQCTGKEMACRLFEAQEEWEATLVLWPDGSRVKKNAMRYHRVPSASASPRALQPPEESTDETKITAAAAASSSSAAAIPAARTPRPERVVEVPRTRGTRSTSAPKRTGAAAAAAASSTPLLLTSPPPRPPPRRSTSRTAEGGTRLLLEDAPTSAVDTAPPRTRASAQAKTDAATRTAITKAVPADLETTPQRPLQRTAVVNSYSATKRRSNPLAVDDDGESAGAAKRATRAPPSFFIDDAAGLDTEDALAQLYSPPTPAERHNSHKAKSSKEKALEAMVKDQQRCIRELRQSRYSKECELDDLKRHLNTVTSTHSALDEYELSARRQQQQQRIQLPQDGEKANVNCSGRAVKKRHGTGRRAASFHSSSSDHEAHLSTVKPLHSHSGRPQTTTSRSDTTAAVREAEAKLKDALRRHRKFEEAVWSYYKALPAELQEKLRVYAHNNTSAKDGVHGASKHEQRRCTAKELHYLRELVRQSERASAQSTPLMPPPRDGDATAASSAEALAVVGDQIEAFAQELARKQAEIDDLRQQLRGKTLQRH